MLALAVCVILLVLAFGALPGGAKIIGKRDGKDVVQLKSGDRVYLDAEQMAAFEKTGEVPVAAKPAPVNRDVMAERVAALEAQVADLNASVFEIIQVITKEEPEAPAKEEPEAPAKEEPEAPAKKAGK